MPSIEEIQRNLTGAWRMMLGKTDGLRLLDLSADGFWNSFFAIVIAAPALFVGWAGFANDFLAAGVQAPGDRFGVLLRLAVTDLSAWVVPLVLLLFVAKPAGIGDRIVHFVVSSNWASAITAWLMLPATLLRLLAPSASQLATLLSLALFAVSMVLTWRQTDAALGKGGTVATAVFAAFFLASLLVLFLMQGVFGLDGPA